MTVNPGPGAHAAHQTERELRKEIAALKHRLGEAEETLRAIQMGEVDSLMVQTGEGPRIFTLQSLEAESNQFRGAILSQVSDAVIATSADDRVVYINAAAERQYGVTASEILGHVVRELHETKWIRPGDEAAANAALTEDGEWHGENIQIPRDGIAFHAEASVTELRDSSGTANGLLSVVRDISERKAAEEQLRRNHETFHHLIQNNPFGIYVMDADFRLREVSLGARKVFRNVEPLIGRDFEEVLRILWPEPFASEAIARHRHTLETGESYSAAPTAERRRDISEAEMYDWRTERVRLPDGRNGVVCYFYDLSERHRWESELAASEERYRAAFAFAPIGIAHVSLDGRWVRFNDATCAIVGRSREALGNLTFAEITHPDDIEADWMLARRLLDGAVNSYTMEKRYVRGDGSIVWVNLTVSLLRDATGRPVNFISIIEDISARIAARREHEKLLQMIEASSDFIATAGMDGTLTYLNKGARQMIGVGEEMEFASIHFADYVPPHWQTFFRETVISTALEKGYWEGEMQLRHLQSGELIDVHRHTFLIRDPQSGEPWCFATVTRDITERKRADAALRRSEMIHRRLAEANLVGVGFGDAKGNVSFINDELLRMMGRTRDEFESGAVQWTECIAPEIRAEHFYMADQLTKEGKIVGYERAFLRPDGGRTPFLGAASLIAPGEDFHVSIALDLTEIRAAEVALRESRERVRLATEATGVGIWEWNILTNRIRWDAQMFRIYGVEPTPDSVIGFQDWLALVVPEERADQDRRLHELAGMGGRSRREFQICRGNDGARRCLDAVEIARKNASGNTEWVVGTSLDITERKETMEAFEIARRQAEAASKAKDDFLSALSHELRTPLTPVMMAASSLLEDPQIDPALRDDLAMILRNVQIEVRLIDDLLDVTRIAHGKLTISARPCDLNEIVERAFQVCRSTLESRSMTVELELAPERMDVLGDATRLQQVFWNLIHNASKFAPEGGRIKVRSAKVGDKIRVSVSDNGVGIDATILPQIFNAFEQGGSATTRRFGGLGLGLVICHGVIALHRGRIFAESAGVGKGATFHVELHRSLSGQG